MKDLGSKMKRQTEQKGRETMRRSILRLSAKLAALGIAVSLMACGSGSDDPNTLGSGGSNPGNNTSGGAGGGGGGGGASSGNPVETPPVAIDPRVFDYGAAMRTASLKLVGELPTLVDLKTLDGKAQADQKVTYEAYIDKILTSDPRFATRMIQWWRDTFRTGPMGGTAKAGSPSYDTAATFAAMVVVNDQPYTDLFTAATNTCPTYASGTFTPASCTTTGPTAGMLTDPGIMSQFYANMAFRRVRFIQETFACTKFPAEFGPSQPMGGGLYTSPWDFQTVTGKTNSPSARIDFQDTSSIICANCHTTINHMAPMFAFFDQNGAYQSAIQVKTPSTGNPTSVIGDWLPPGKQTFAWRNGVAVTDIPSLGTAIAADPAVAHCAVDRVWNWAMSRGDIVNDLATIPPTVTDPLVKDFTSNGMKMKRVIRNVFTSEDFTKF
jgi:Protein of unknown function (DUF1588)